MTMTDEVIVEPATPAASEFASLGERLLAAREAKKLSQQDVSDSLRFSVKQISALERGDYDALPDAMITRGFIRNYARFVEIDAEPLLASYRVYVPDQLPGTLSMESLMHEVMPGKDSQPWLQYILGSILVLLFLLAWFFYMDYMPKPAPAEADKMPLVVATTDNTPVEINMPEIALPAEERLADGAADVATKPVTSDANQAATIAPLNAAPSKVSADENTEAAAKNKLPPVTAPVVAAVDAAKLKADAAKPAVAAVSATAVTKPEAAVKTETAVKAEIAAPAKLAPANTKKVTMSFTDESWVRATDKSGKVVFEKILPAGSQDGFEGVPPLNLVIGNASATKLIYLGKPVDLAAVTQSNVARLTLE